MVLVKALGESDRINLPSVTGGPAEFGKLAQKVYLNILFSKSNYWNYAVFQCSIKNTIKT